MTRIPINDDDMDLEEAAEGDAGDNAAAQVPDSSDPEAASRAPNAGTTGAADVRKLLAERDDLYNRLARATADFKNTQKRIQTESDQRVQYANQSLIKSLLPVIDNFERALAVDANKVDAAAILRGMQIVHDQWLAMLKQQQIEEIAPKPGTPFDPTRHEALMQQDSPYKTPSVVQLLQKGYSLHDRTLRPAQVAVSKSS
jgi:molecular chaperone GrpE